MLSSCQSEKIGGGGEGGTLMVDYVYVHSSHRIIVNLYMCTDSVNQTLLPSYIPGLAQG